MRRDPRGAADDRSVRRAALVLGALAVVAPQLLGGATDGTASAIFLFACVGGTVAAMATAARRGSLGDVPLLGLAAATAAAWTLVQALPLPCAWLQWAQPERRGVVQSLSELGVLSDPTCHISAAPGATLTAVAMGGVLAMLVVAACAVSRAGGRRVLLRGVALSAIAMACVALGHWALDAKEVFGIYTPRHVRPRLLVAPLLNENHLAGLLALGWPPCLSLALSAKRVDGAVAWFTGAMVVFATGLLSLSRGGTVVLVLGGAVYLLFHVYRRRISRLRLLWLGGATVVCFTGGAYIAADRLLREFGGDPHQLLSKLAITQRLLPLFAQHPITGIGRRAMEDVSGSVLDANLRVLFAECLPAQWLIEWGLPCTLLLAVTVGASGWLWCSRGMRRGDAALACGLGAVFVHNLVDFSLELPGVATTAAIACGCLAAGEPPGRIQLPLARGVTLASASAWLALLLAAPWLTFWSRLELRKELGALAVSHPSQVAAELPRAFRYYPFDPSLMLTATQAALRTDSQRTGRWLNLAMSVVPGWSGPHLLAGQALERRGAIPQAAIELSFALRSVEGPAMKVSCDFLMRHPRGELAWQLAAEVAVGQQQHLLEYFTSCLPVHLHRDEGEDLAKRIVERFPSSRTAHATLVHAALGRGDAAVAEQRARAMYAQLSDDPAALSTLVSVLIASNRALEALAAIDTAPPALRNDLSLMQREAEAAGALQLKPRFVATVSRMLVQHGQESSQRAAIHRHASATMDRQKDYYGALSHAQSTYDLTGSPADLELVHAAAVHAGVVAIALRTASELCQFRHRVELYCPKASALPSTGPAAVHPLPPAPRSGLNP